MRQINDGGFFRIEEFLDVAVNSVESVPRRNKRVVVLGATGSIGESALKVARDIPERMEIVGLAAKSQRAEARGAGECR